MNNESSRQDDLNQNGVKQKVGKRLAVIALLALGYTILFNVMSPKNTYSQQPNEKVQQAMIEAINDEYKARALYTAVIEKFGDVRPFSNIVQAEERHVQQWKTLFNQYGLPIPEDTFAGNVEAPETLQAACENSVEAEIADAQMYDHFLEFVEEPDLRATFTQLRNVSRNNHQRAFERCVNRFANASTSTSYEGQSQGRQGQGRQGQGRGQRHSRQGQGRCS